MSIFAQQKTIMLTQPKYHYINLRYLTQMSDSKEFVLEMVDIFRSQSPELMKKLLSNFKAKDIEALRHTTHKIKGAFAIMGVSCLDDRLLYFEENENILLSEFEPFIQSYIFTCSEVESELDLVVNEYKNQ